MKNKSEALNSYQILDTEPEEKYDSITSLASFICNTPAALINFIDGTRQWTKSKVGMDIYEIPTEIAFCQHTIQNSYLLEVKDSLQDERFMDNPLVTGSPGIRYYAGVPLVTPEGEHIGALCAIDFKPNELNDHQKAALKILAREVITQLELGKKNLQLEHLITKDKEFKDLFNYSGDIHCITNLEGKVEYINDTVYTLLGYHPEDILGKTIWDFSVPGERDRVMPPIYEAIAKGATTFQIETKVLRADGSIRWYEWCDVLKSGKWLVNGRDITDRKANEQELKALTLAVEKSAAGVIVRNALGEIEWFNEAFEHTIGYTLSELKGKTFGDLLIGPQTDPAVLRYALDCLANRKPYEIEIILYKKNNIPVWVFVSNNPSFSEEGVLDRQIGVMIDITERKRAEEQLIKTREDAINLSKAKENFLSVMSHEMRTPLNAVIGMTRILKAEDPLEHQQNNLNILEFSAENLLTLINDVLDFTKIETGNLQLESVPVDLRALASKTIASLKFKTQNKNLDVNLEIDSKLPETLVGDPTRLYQIFMNLLGNSLKFTEQGEVKLGIYLLEENRENLNIRFEISDTGIGIAANKLATLFDPYTQAESDTARKYGGTGLGLAITKKLVSLHQSELKVESELGKGTKFYFVASFPKVVSLQGAANDIIEPETALDAKLLVVDDNAINRILARKILAKWSVETEFAENGLEAIQKLQEDRFDLVLMDIHMPVMGGFEASRAIKNLENLSSIPIVALTGSVIEPNDADFRESGMDGFILKPFEPSILYKKIKPLLKHLE